MSTNYGSINYSGYGYTGTITGANTIGAGVFSQNSVVNPLHGTIQAQAEICTTNIAPPAPVKTSVTYVVIKSSGETLELVVGDKISAREIVNLSKFISLTATTHGLSVDWSTLIKTLGIEKHFVRGKKASDYVNAASSELYVCLFDPA